MVAKTWQHKRAGAQLQADTGHARIGRWFSACLRSGGVTRAIGRDPRNPLRFKVSTTEVAKPARTHYARIDSARAAGAEISWIACRLETGRTHQIRVHLEHIGHPLIGDPMYRRKLPTRGEPPASWKEFDRQALHACRLSLDHPISRGGTWFFNVLNPILSSYARTGLWPARRLTASFNERMD